MPIYKMPGSKDGKQKYRVRINYTDKNGKQHQLDRVAYGSTEAKMLEAQLQKEHSDNGTGIAHLTIWELYQEYMEVKRHELRETSYDKSRRILEANILPILGDVRIDRLNTRILQNWKNGIANRSISIVTQKAIYTELRTMLNYAVKMEYLVRNPLTAIGNFKDKDFTSPKDKLHYYTPEQFHLFIQAARNYAEEENTLSAWGYYVFFAIAYYTGMRKGEINALKWSDIEKNIINVRRSISQKIKGEKITETPPKNRTSYRSLQMPDPLMDILAEHRARYQANGAFSNNLRVCGGNQCLSDTGIDQKNRKFAETAGLPRIRIHDFRHSHASLLANEGINIQEIARRLGHAKIEQTWNTYSHLYPREEERAIQILNRIK